MATLQDIVEFKAKFSELGLGDASIASALNTADIMMDIRVWPNKADFALARMLLAAHLLTMQKLQIASFSLVGSGGLIDMFIQSITFGERSVGFGRRVLMQPGRVTDPGEAMLEATSYGQLFVQLRSRNIIPVMTV